MSRDPRETNAALVAVALNRGILAATELTMQVGFRPQPGKEYTEDDVLQMWRMTVEDWCAKTIKEGPPAQWIDAEQKAIRLAQREAGNAN